MFIVSKVGKVLYWIVVNSNFIETSLKGIYLLDRTIVSLLVANLARSYERFYLLLATEYGLPTILAAKL